MTYWTAEETETLRKEYQCLTTTLHDIGRMVGRTSGAVVARAKRLGLRRPRTHSREWWTDERMERLKELVLADRTYSEIGYILGISRYACIGKSHRMELPRRFHRTKSDAERLEHRRLRQQRYRALNREKVRQWSREYRQRHKWKKRATKFKPRPKNIPFVPEPIVMPKNLPQLRPLEFNPVHLVQIRNGQCKFIEGNDRMCCARKTIRGKDWCEHHYARVYQVDRRSSPMAGIY